MSRLKPGSIEGTGNILRSGIVTPVECLHYPMSLPTSVVITGCDSMQVLEQALDATRTFKPMSDADRHAHRAGCGRWRAGTLQDQPDLR